MIFRNCIKSCNHHCNPISDQLHDPKEVPCTLIFSQDPWPQTSTGLLSVTVPFCVWLFYWAKYFLKFIHIVGSIGFFFFNCAVHFFIGWCIFEFFSSLGLLWIMLQWTFECMSFLDIHFHFFWVDAEKWMLTCMLIACLILFVYIYLILFTYVYCIYIYIYYFIFK